LTFVPRLNATAIPNIEAAVRKRRRDLFSDGFMLAPHTSLIIVVSLEHGPERCGGDGAVRGPTFENGASINHWSFPSTGSRLQASAATDRLEVPVSPTAIAK
jgi:hypothetical protein